MQALADKVVAGITAQPGVTVFNGVHMRMEKDAADWAIIMGGRARLWQLYKDAMTRAGLDPDTPLFVASGLLKAASEDTWAKEEMQRLTDDIVASKVRAALWAQGWLRRQSWLHVVLRDALASWSALMLLAVHCQH